MFRAGCVIRLYRFLIIAFLSTLQRSRRKEGFLHLQLADMTSNAGVKKLIEKVQGVSQSQTAVNPRHQEEEKNDKN